MNFYHPDPHMNSIRERKKPHINFVTKKEELTFPTWTEAHDWLVDKRRKEFMEADTEAEKARKRLLAARKMKPKTF